MCIRDSSWMQPGATIPEHTDDRDPLAWLRVVHMGLVVPENCYLETSWDQNSNSQGSTRRVEQVYGKAFDFDDSFPHSAVNLSDSDRVILYLKLRMLPPKYEIENKKEVRIDKTLKEI
eukprot:TRINITY_DN1406_c0_g1_i2.p1 TRINITY_DN1406_c0_g1~~TRINITY_DN1406_c0_g1_i2.p1  ORF type:complete len:118 (-),score=14.19 TRINITY_DN1406_c0_g1_i2:38-391(-)